MGYALGVDIGTTFSAAAIFRNGEVEPLPLASSSDAMPSVVYVGDDDELVVGEAAARRELADPSGAGRDFKRRFGDPAPLLLRGRPFSIDLLTARLLRFVLERAQEVEGAPPDAVVITHPAAWGPYHVEILRQSARLAGLDDVEFVSEPEAAARHYAAQERVDPGAHVAVYDLGGGTFDATVLRKREAGSGFDVAGQPQGIERLGGVDFDEVLLGFVAETLGTRFTRLPGDNPAVARALARLRAECRAAKEQLSADTEATILVEVGDIDTQVRVTRSEFEARIRLLLEETVQVLQRAIKAADLEPDDLHSVLLVGGSSRVPVVGQIVATALGRPVAVDAHPKYAVAAGAARAAGELAGAAAEEDAGPAAPSRRDWPARLRQLASIGDRRAAVLAGIATVLVLAVVFATVLIDRPASAVATLPGTPSTAPDVQEQPRREAMQALIDAGFIARVQYQLHPSVPAGTVIRQEPPPRQQVELGTAITIFVSSGAQGVRVPDVTRMPRADAIRTLLEDGLGAEVNLVTGDGAADTVVATTPAAGAVHAQGAAVVLDVLQAQPTVAVPDVAGRPGSEAEALLRQAGFDVQLVGEVADGQPSGVALATRPPAATEMGPGEPVTLVVSVLPPAAQPESRAASRFQREEAAPRREVEVPKVNVPGVVQRPLAEAEAELRRFGFVAEVTHALNDAPAGQVIDQNPGAGAAHPPGHAVALVVSGGSSPVAVPGVVGQHMDTAIAMLQDASLAPAVHYQVGSDEREYTVLNVDPAAGAEVTRDHVVTLTVARRDPLVAVPRLVGMHPSAATAALRRIGLSAAQIGRFRQPATATAAIGLGPLMAVAAPSPGLWLAAAGDAGDGGVVVETQPAAGVEIGVNSQVTLVQAVDVPPADAIATVRVAAPEPQVDPVATGSSVLPKPSVVDEAPRTQRSREQPDDDGGVRSPVDDDTDSDDRTGTSQQPADEQDVESSVDEQDRTETPAETHEPSAGETTGGEDAQAPAGGPETAPSEATTGPEAGESQPEPGTSEAAEPEPALEPDPGTTEPGPSVSDPAASDPAANPGTSEPSIPDPGVSQGDPGASQPTAPDPPTTADPPAPPPPSETAGQSSEAQQPPAPPQPPEPGPAAGNPPVADPEPVESPLEPAQPATEPLLPRVIQRQRPAALRLRRPLRPRRG